MGIPGLGNVFKPAVGSFERETNWRLFKQLDSARHWPNAVCAVLSVPFSG